MENFIYNEGDQPTKYKSATKNYLLEVGAWSFILFATVWIAGKAWKESQEK
jgi:hypothetical protein